MESTELTKIDWKSIVLDPRFLNHIESLSLRRFSDSATAQQSVTYVIEALSSDDWAVCKRFQGKSKPSTFLHTLTNNFLEEFARKQYGRPRPPTWLQQQGDLWVKIWKWCCLERQMEQSVVDQCSQGHIREPDFIRNIIRVIKSRIPSCGETGPGVCLTDDGDVELLSDSLGHYGESQDAVTELERATSQSLRVLITSITTDAEKAKTVDEELDGFDCEACPPIADKLFQLRSALKLSNEETLLLRLVYVEGMSKTKASTLLGLAEHQGGRILQAAFKRIRMAFETAGLSLEILESFVR